MTTTNPTGRNNPSHKKRTMKICSALDNPIDRGSGAPKHLNDTPRRQIGDLRPDFQEEASPYAPIIRLRLFIDVLNASEGDDTTSDVFISEFYLHSHGPLDRTTWKMRVRESGSCHTGQVKLKSF
jgi:hypothetical protein